MLDRLMDGLDFHGKALVMRADRQQVLSSNIANADTPYYKARDFDFHQAMRDATGYGAGGIRPGSMSSGLATTASTQAPHFRIGADVTPTVALARSSAAHLPGTAGDAGARTISTKYSSPQQGAVDGNTVDMNRERTNFAENAIQYEATLRFINGRVRTLNSAIRGE